MNILTVPIFVDYEVLLLAFARDVGSKPRRPFRGSPELSAGAMINI